MVKGTGQTTCQMFELILTYLIKIRYIAPVFKSFFLSPYWPGPPPSLPYHGGQPCQPQLFGGNGAQASVPTAPGYPVQVLTRSPPHAGRGRLHQVGSILAPPSEILTP